ncbi:ribonuclease E inhibitor RraB (plasmid) [Streptomyces sp. NEAU-sy36]|uniref:ribonuclease E inhibitor RraB n=1 Tax=unclassified Streptomyces TaxID=2593676 RepID=UPI0015D5F494|nr:MULTISPECIES: ribonuclease E inhibitor RraB [unclassified Streptomyces]QLJ06824.1 ribonuclease E inhibitor RraB [Streptomyces sp. NEAU-sy36]
MSMIPYTHWAYFQDEASARRCAEDLPDFVIRIRPPQEDIAEWLLLAGRDVEIDHMVERHHEVQAIVERHDGFYDGGESTWDLNLGQAVADPVLTGEWEIGKNS